MNFILKSIKKILLIDMGREQNIASKLKIIGMKMQKFILIVLIIQDMKNHQILLVRVKKYKYMDLY